MVAQVQIQKTCKDCPNFKRSMALPHIGFCQLYLQNVRAYDRAGNDCPPNQKQKRIKAVRKPQSVELVEISGWLQGEGNTVYKLSSWKVLGETGNTYDVLYDTRGSVICNCPGHTTHKHCYHAEAVELEWREQQKWTNQKNSLDLARNDGF
jgi:hypothetical protein